MEIQKKITYQFTVIVAVLMLVSFIAIYFLFSSERKDSFFTRLADKANLVTKLKTVTPDDIKESYENFAIKLPREVFLVYDSKGELIFTNTINQAIKLSDSMKQKFDIRKEFKYKEKDYEIFCKIGKDNSIVLIAAKDIYGFRKLKKLRIILILVFLTNLLIMLFIGRFFAAKALKPISNIINQVNSINIDNISSRIHAGSDNDEIAQLAFTFNKMLSRIEESVIIQKDFITNSSHELRNPLAAITGQLEVTLLKDRTTTEYKDTLNSVLEDIKNLNQLANRLLVLSRAINDLTPDNFMHVRVDDVLWEARSEVLKNHKNYEVLFHFNESIKDEQHFTINGNEALLKIAFVNLIDNGCKYSDNHRIDVDLSVKEEQLIMLFKDNGIGIPGDEITYIFEPFYRAKNVRKNKGHGIGLSLVDKIIKLHKAEIKVNSTIKQGTEFEVSFFLN